MLDCLSGHEGSIPLRVARIDVVRINVVRINAALTQWIRVTVYEAVGRGFESLKRYQV